MTFAGYVFFAAAAFCAVWPLLAWWIRRDEKRLADELKGMASHPTDHEGAECD
jgi:hypothetical protein